MSDRSADQLAGIPMEISAILSSAFHCVSFFPNIDFWFSRLLIMYSGTWIILKKKLIKKTNTFIKEIIKQIMYFSTPNSL